MSRNYDQGIIVTDAASNPGQSIVTDLASSPPRSVTVNTTTADIAQAIKDLNTDNR
jgi:hypothetical protein